MNIKVLLGNRYKLFFFKILKGIRSTRKLEFKV